MPRTNGEIGDAKMKTLNKIVEYCGGSIFVAVVSALIVYALHGWSWPSEINGVSLNLPEFLILLVLITLPFAICIDTVRHRHRKGNVTTSLRPDLVSV
jgi:hypothetical protein